MCGLLMLFCADISGVPGTGKTATVHAVVRELKRMAESQVRKHTLFSSRTILITARFLGNIPIHIRRDQWPQDSRACSGIQSALGRH